MIELIVSGGQTGVDRAALDAAIHLGIPYGGWCPKGRLDETGTIPQKYTKLKEIDGDFKSEKDNYEARTVRNIHESDGTLILIPKMPLPITIQDGTLLTIDKAKSLNKPHLIVDLSASENDNLNKILKWLNKNCAIMKLNVAGPRELSSPGIYKKSLSLLKSTFALLHPRRSKNKM